MWRYASATRTLRMQKDPCMVIHATVYVNVLARNTSILLKIDDV